MLKTAFLTAVTLAIAIGGGAGSVWLALDRDFGLDTITVGEWTAFPERGTPAADPYSKARFSREADLALGRAEGVTFTARVDADGNLLRRDCDYTIRGSFPAARFWTLFARDSDGDLIEPGNGRASALHSYAMLRDGDNTIATTVSRQAAPGNWLALAGNGTFHLVLTFYDTATASGARIGDIELPTITRVSCNG